MFEEYIFRAKISDGYCIKILTEMLQHNIKNGHYVADEKGMHLSMCDTKMHIKFTLDIPESSFVEYHISMPRVSFCVSQMHLYTMLKNIKKKDSVVLFVHCDKNDMLGIEIEPSQRTKITTSYIHMVPFIKNVEDDGFNCDYGQRTASVLASDFSKACKEIGKISKTITICTNTGSVKFISGDKDIYYKEVSIFSNNNIGRNCSDNGGEIRSTYKSDFFSTISKISSISTNMQMYHSKEHPLMMQTHIGYLGVITIYCKSIEQIDKSTEGVYDIVEI